MLKDNSLRLGYSLDLTTVGQTAKSPTSHEVLISYALPAPKLFGGKRLQFVHQDSDINNFFLQNPTEAIYKNHK